MISNSAERVSRGLLVVFLAVSGCAGRAEPPADTLQGVVEFDEVSLAFDLAGRVSTVSVKKGDTVIAGAAVAELDDTLSRSAREASESQAEVAKSQVSVAQAGARPEEIGAAAARVRAAKAAEDLLHTNLLRQKSLLAQGAVPSATVDDLQSQLERATAERQSLAQSLALLQRGARAVDVNAAEAKADAARTAVRLDDVRLQHHALTAPIAGTVLDVHVDPGEVVAPGTPVITLADAAHPYADVFVPQANLAGIRVGGGAQARIDAHQRSFTGRVEHIERRTEFTPRYLFSERERPNLVVRVRVRLEDPKQQLFAGVPAFVTIERQP
jgi:HlyD family secretion protein